MACTTKVDYTCCMARGGRVKDNEAVKAGRASFHGKLGLG
jgi:hypothetical protein